MFRTPDTGKHYSVVSIAVHIKMSRKLYALLYFCIFLIFCLSYILLVVTSAEEVIIIIIIIIIIIYYATKAAQENTNIQTYKTYKKTREAIRNKTMLYWAFVCLFICLSVCLFVCNFV